MIQRLIEGKGLIYGTRRSLSGVYRNQFLRPPAGCTAILNIIHQEQRPSGCCTATFCEEQPVAVLS